MVPIATRIDLLMGHGTVKALKDDIYCLVCQRNPPMVPAKLDIVDEVVDKEEEAW